MSLGTQIASAILESAKAVDIKKIAQDLNVSDRVVARIVSVLRSNGFEVYVKQEQPGLVGFSEKTQEMILFLQKEGWEHSAKEIGEKFKISKQRVSQIEERARRRGLITYVRKRKKVAYAIPMEFSNPGQMRKEKCDKFIIENYKRKSQSELFEMAKKQGYAQNLVKSCITILRKSGKLPKLRKLSSKIERRMNFVATNAAAKSKSQMAQELGIVYPEIYRIINLIEECWGIKVQCYDGRKKARR